MKYVGLGRIFKIHRYTPPLPSHESSRLGAIKPFKHIGKAPKQFTCYNGIFSPPSKRQVNMLPHDKLGKLHRNFSNKHSQNNLRAAPHQVTVCKVVLSELYMFTLRILFNCYRGAVSGNDYGTRE